MALSDYAIKKAGGESSGTSSKLSLAVKLPPLDPLSAMSRLLKAIHASDAEGAYDAFCELQEAHQDERSQALETSDDEEAY